MLLLALDAAFPMMVFVAVDDGEEGVVVAVMDDEGGGAGNMSVLRNKELSILCLVYRQSRDKTLSFELP